MAYRFYSKFSVFSKQHPVVTLTITNCALAAIADVFAQTVTNFNADLVYNSESTFDTYRFFRFIMYQGAFAPICYKWYSFLDRKIPVQVSSTDKTDLPMTNKDATNSKAAGKTSKFTAIYKPVLKRVAADQLLFAPIGIGCFFICMTVLEGGGWQQVQTKLNETYATAMTSNWKVWPLVQFVNFCYVPLFYRLPFASFVGIFWNTYLSYINGQAAPIAAAGN